VGPATLIKRPALVDITDLAGEAADSPRPRPAQGVVRIIGKTMSGARVLKLDWLAAHAFGGGQPHDRKLRPRVWLPGARAPRHRATSPWAKPCRSARGTRGCASPGDAGWLAGRGWPFLSGVPRRKRRCSRRFLWSGACSRPTTAHLRRSLGAATENLAYSASSGSACTPTTPYRDPVPDFRRCTP